MKKNTDVFKLTVGILLMIPAITFLLYVFSTMPYIAQAVIFMFISFIIGWIILLSL
jgi:hypothetical protein